MKVIGIGDNVVDKYMHISTMFPGGNALNFSVYAKILGADSSYLGTFGDDVPAEHINRVLKERGIETEHCRYVQGENGYAMVNIVNEDRVFVGGNKGGIQKDHKIILNEEDLKYINGFDLVHTSCFSYMEEEIVKIKEIGVPVSFDFSNRFDGNYLREVCPKLDFSFLSCSHLTEEETKNTLKEIYNYGCKIAVGTRGVEGSILYDGDKFYYQEAHLVQAVDPLGAGDSFITAFLLGYMEGLKSNLSKGEIIRSSMNKGADFAAETCKVYGAFGNGLKF